jgi:hypothetical protein
MSLGLERRMLTTVAFLGLIVMFLGLACCAYALYLIENKEI